MVDMTKSHNGRLHHQNLGNAGLTNWRDPEMCASVIIMLMMMKTTIVIIITIWWELTYTVSQVLFSVFYPYFLIFSSYQT